MDTLKILRIVALLEGISLLLLFLVGMPLKYLLGMKDINYMIGMAHGVLFLAYCVLVIIAAMEFKWTAKITIICLLASVVPFGTFIADKKYFREVKV